MKILLASLLLTLAATTSLADTKISQLPLDSAAATNVNDSFPFVNSVIGETERLLLSDLINLPSMQAQFATMVPSQVGQNGNCLKSNGTISLWGDCTVGAVTAIGLLDFPSPSSNGLVITGKTLYAQSASTSNPGMVNTTTQSFAGNKTFTGTIAASNLSGTNTGDNTFSVPLVNTAGNVAINGNVATNKLGFADPSDATKVLNINVDGESTATTTTIAALAAQNTVLNIQPTVDSTANVIVQNAVTQQINIGANTALAGSNSGIIYSQNAHTNRSQLRLNDYNPSGASVAGITTSSTPSGTIGVNAAVPVSTDISKWTVQAGAQGINTDPISASFAFKTAATINTSTVPMDWHLSLENLAGTGVADVVYVTSEGVVKFPKYTLGIAHFSAAGLITSSLVDLAADTTGINPLSQGGTGVNAASANAAFNALSPMTASGDIIYGGTAGAATRLPKASNGMLLGLAAGLPAWLSPGAASALSCVVKTANYVMTASDTCIFADTTSASFTLTFPQSSTAPGILFFIKKLGNNTLTINPFSGDLIDGETSQPIVVPYTGVVLLPDGTTNDYVF